MIVILSAGEPCLEINVRYPISYHLGDMVRIQDNPFLYRRVPGPP
jgi:hypothetical protein